MNDVIRLNSLIKRMIIETDRDVYTLHLDIIYIKKLKKPDGFYNFRLYISKKDLGGEGFIDFKTKNFFNPFSSDKNRCHYDELSEEEIKQIEENSKVLARLMFADKKAIERTEEILKNFALPSNERVRDVVSNLYKEQVRNKKILELSANISLQSVKRDIVYTQVEKGGKASERIRVIDTEKMKTVFESDDDVNETAVLVIEKTLTGNLSPAGLLYLFDKKNQLDKKKDIKKKNKSK